jgi:CRISPR system Cascade subunit CasD
MHPHLLVRLEAPIVSFGSEAIDNRGFTDDLPGLSLMTGLIANALGWMRHEGERHERLQSRLVMGVRVDRPGIRQTDFQTAQLRGDDAGWTTHGVVETRSGGVDTYNAPHLRWRDQICDASMLVAFRLDAVTESPTLDEVAEALARPARPLFIGRKHCLPHAPLLVGRLDAEDVPDALGRAPWPDYVLAGTARARWSAGESERAGSRTLRVGDERRWVQGVHAGTRAVIDGVVHR